MKLEFLNVITNKLHDELIAAGIIPKLVESCDNITWITVDDAQIETANAVAAVHDPNPKPFELRAKAYSNEKIIPWQDNVLTVDEARAQWFLYAPECSSKADELIALIQTAKANIREMHPDV